MDLNTCRIAGRPLSARPRGGGFDGKTCIVRKDG